jgi:non-specific serine/threonine protein kinase
MSAGHGGQTLVSSCTRALLDERFPLHELGEHRLKDFDEPVSLFQLGKETFPPLKTISNTNLPRPASSFVGREREVGEVVALVRDGARLVTLTGPGGSGKTRLAIETAAELVPEFKAGVFWVGLATLRDPALVLETIARELGAKGELSEHIGEREMLLLLDNLEQVVNAAPELAGLTEACPNLRLLVTSRELMRIRGEVEYQVLPLAEPDAVELFCARAQVEPGKAVEELCRRLDHMPLALELAASRARILTPEQILERLSQRLDLLQGGRDADPRQRTLRATIEWSHDLLSPGEQQLFARLSVFAGGCTLEAAEEICDADLDTLQSLAEKSLLRFTDERFWMLETIREYAGERLEETCEEDLLRAGHADYFMRFAEEAREHLMGPDADAWVAQLEIEHDNCRAALSWALSRPDAEQALRLCGALHGFWYQRDHVREGRDLAERALALPNAVGEARAPALGPAGEFALIQGDVACARRRLEEQVELCQSAGDASALAHALTLLGHVRAAEGEPGLARELYQQSHRLIADEAPSTAWGPTPGVTLNNIAFAMSLEGDFDDARDVLEEGLEWARDQGSRLLECVILVGLADVRLELAEPEEARARLSDSLRILTEVPNLRLGAIALQLLARLLIMEGRIFRAAKLHGAAKMLREAGGVVLETGSEAQFLAVEEAVNAAGWAKAVDEGTAMTPESALEYALADRD